MSGSEEQIVQAVCALGLLVVIAATLTLMVLKRVGLYSIAKRRGLKHTWLAWLPVTDRYVLGWISDQYQSVTAGKKTRRRKVLLAFGCAVPVIVAVLGVSLVILFILGVLSLFTFGLIWWADQEFSDVAMVLLVVVGIGMFAVWIVSVCDSIWQYVSLYDLYRSCKPQDSTAYTVLSVLLPVTASIFVFLCRKQDDGICLSQWMYQQELRNTLEMKKENLET